jgi:peptidoglycan/LPS O-acetylase OafA/YrhL
MFDTSAPAALRPAASARNMTADGLRGVAAMLVVVYHLYINIESALRANLPVAVHDLIHEFGGTGVRVFFVLSGFVISMSLRGALMSGRFVAMFALRRSVRLDPPYWAAMALCMVLAQVSARIVSDDAGRGHYSTAQVLAHLVYLQDVLGYPQISAVFWTLCIELQFYLVLVLLLMTAARLPTKGGAVWLVATLSAISVGVAVADLKLPVRGLFLPYWHMFGLGILTCWCLFGDVSWRWWGALMLAEFGLVFGMKPNLATLAPLMAAVVLVLAARWHPARNWLNSALSQYLGRLSYSLYLMHPIIGWSTISVLKRLFGEQSFVLGLLYVAVGVVTSVLSAHLLYRLVELPAVRLSKKVRLPGQAPGQGPDRSMSLRITESQGRS